MTSVTSTVTQGNETIVQRNILASLLAGATAGMMVDLVLFPLDTIKTRLQSQIGFRAAGSFTNLYRGLSSAMIVSAPNAAAFFSVYETTKKMGSSFGMRSEMHTIFLEMLASSFGETAACLIRVPVETIKQRAQASDTPLRRIVREALIHDKVYGLYRGFLSTIARDIPFALIQLPLWEYTKRLVSKVRERKVSSLESALCGSFAGFTAAICTNPIDVAKTRIMLARQDPVYSTYNFIVVLKHIILEGGFKGLYAGATPRILFITIGGAIYLGGYDLSLRFFESSLRPRSKSSDS